MARLRKNPVEYAREEPIDLGQVLLYCSAMTGFWISRFTDLLLRRAGIEDPTIDSALKKMESMTSMTNINRAWGAAKAQFTKERKRYNDPDFRTPVWIDNMLKRMTYYQSRGVSVLGEFTINKIMEFASQADVPFSSPEEAMGMVAPIIQQMLDRTWIEEPTLSQADGFTLVMASVLSKREVTRWLLKLLDEEIFSEAKAIKTPDGNSIYSEAFGSGELNLGQKVLDGLRNFRDTGRSSFVVPSGTAYFRREPVVLSTAAYERVPPGEQWRIFGREIQGVIMEFLDFMRNVSPLASIYQVERTLAQFRFTNDNFLWPNARTNGKIDLFRWTFVQYPRLDILG